MIIILYIVIVDTIGSIDDLIEKYEFINNKIDILIGEIVQKKINKTECFCTLANVAKVQNGFCFTPSQYLPAPSKINNKLEVLKMGHIDQKGGLKNDPKKDYVEYDTKYDKWILNENDIVMGMTDMKDKVVILGVPAIIDYSNKYVLNQRVARIIPQKSLIHPLILYYQMRDSLFINELRKYANSGVQVNLSTDAIKKMNIKLPEQSVQLELINIIEPIFSQFKDNNKFISSLKLLKKYYLDKYFR